ncbi:ribonucleoside-triphosphate reductase [bacterium DOLZORAL124_38_8]|nr:MAG: ribonucleoside-triphosphate reductase [bacterium DOLZORAL124_38_8]
MTTTSTANVQDNSKRQKCEIWTRVMGYHRPVSHFNTGKKSEHFSRQHFEENCTMNSKFCEKY